MKISILRLFGKIWTNIYKNKSTYLAVATVLQLTLLAGVWLISNIFRLALNFAGEDNLDKNNIYHIFPHHLILNEDVLHSEPHYECCFRHHCVLQLH